MNNSHKSLNIRSTPFSLDLSFYSFLFFLNCFILFFFFLFLIVSSSHICCPIFSTARKPNIHAVLRTFEFFHPVLTRVNSVCKSNKGPNNEFLHAKKATCSTISDTTDCPFQIYSISLAAWSL